MISNLFWLLNYIRTSILETFTLPELGISYWDFLVTLALVGVVATILINSVRVSSRKADRARSDSKKEEKGK